MNAGLAGREIIQLHLNKRLGFGVFLIESMSDKGAKHVLAVDFLGAVSLCDNLLADAKSWKSEQQRLGRDGE